MMNGFSVGSLKLANGIDHATVRDAIEHKHLVFTTRPELLTPFDCDFYVFAVDLDQSPEVIKLGSITVGGYISSRYYQHYSPENYDQSPLCLSLFDRQQWLDRFVTPVMFDYSEDFIVTALLSDCKRSESNIICTDMPVEDHPMMVHIDQLDRLTKKPDSSRNSFLYCNRMVSI